MRFFLVGLMMEGVAGVQWLLGRGDAGPVLRARSETGGVIAIVFAPVLVAVSIARGLSAPTPALWVVAAAAAVVGVALLRCVAERWPRSGLPSPPGPADLRQELAVATDLWYTAAVVVMLVVVLGLVAAAKAA